VNGALFARTWAAQRLKLLVVAVALAIWGTLMPIIYQAFRSQITFVLDSGLIPKGLMSFGGGDMFSLAGVVALGFIHPLAVAMVLVFALGFTVNAVAGERQRGTLEVLLARPISRRSLYVTLLAASVLFIAVAIAAQVVGIVVGSALSGALGGLPADRLAQMWLNAFLVFVAIGAVSLLASVSFDRLSPALTVSLAVVLVSYFLEILGSLWTDARGLQPWSLFHYLDPRGALAGTMTAADWMVPVVVIVVAVAAALVVFPRRDLAAPS
jgi:ABC-2 type transport system permease protein